MLQARAYARCRFGKVVPATRPGLSAGVFFAAASMRALKWCQQRDQEPSAYNGVARVSLEDTPMNAVIYIVGLVVIIGLVLGFLGLR